MTLETDGFQSGSWTLEGAWGIPQRNGHLNSPGRKAEPEKETARTRVAAAAPGGGNRRPWASSRGFISQLCPLLL